jgi:hypothetical protein
MAYCLAQYYMTAKQSDYWPPASNLALYPTYMCFIVGTISAIFSFIVLSGYFWGTDVANRWADRRGIFTKIGGVIKIVLSLIVIINMKLTSDSDSPYSLWSVVCNTSNQQKFLGQISFDRGCSFQVLSPSL